MVRLLFTASFDYTTTLNYILIGLGVIGFLAATVVGSVALYNSKNLRVGKMRNLLIGYLKLLRRRHKSLTWSNSRPPQLPKPLRYGCQKINVRASTR